MSSYIAAKVIADTRLHTRVTTLQIKCPRIILAQINKHRTSIQSWHSSRAVPVETLIARLLEDNYVPTFRKNRRGMQPGELIHGDELEALWLAARDQAIEHARALVQHGVHKQWANRLLEPFSCATGVITMSDRYEVPLGDETDSFDPWERLFALRCSPANVPAHLPQAQSQDEFQALADAMKAARDQSQPVTSMHWHFPFVTIDELNHYREGELQRISAMRCARASYHAPDTLEPNPEADLAKIEELIAQQHTTPLEHPAIAAKGQWGVLNGWRSLHCELLLRGNGLSKAP